MAETELQDLGKHQDRILNDISRWKTQEADRASDAAATRSEIGTLIKDTGVNKKALAMIRALDKLPGDKREDVLRSFDALREVFDGKWNGQSSMDFDDDAPEPADESKLDKEDLDDIKSLDDFDDEPNDGSDEDVDDGAEDDFLGQSDDEAA